MRRLALLVLAASLAAPAAASAAIVPQQGISGVSIDMTRAAVKARLGAPVTTRRGVGAFGPWTTFAYRGLLVTFTGNRTATSIATTGRSERTAHGVGVGSTQAQVAARVRGARCLTESGYRHCYVGRWLGGQVVTDFAIEHGRVVRVTVGLVID